MCCMSNGQTDGQRVKKLAIQTWPRRSAGLKGLPEESTSENSGSVLRTGGGGSYEQRPEERHRDAPDGDATTYGSARAACGPPPPSGRVSFSRRAAYLCWRRFCRAFRRISTISTKRGAKESSGRENAPTRRRPPARRRSRCRRSRACGRAPSGAPRARRTPAVAQTSVVLAVVIPRASVRERGSIPAASPAVRASGQRVLERIASLLET